MAGRKQAVSVLRSPFRLVGAAAFGALLGLPAPAPAQGRPDCALVLRKLHDISGHDGAGTPDAEKVAKKLDTDADWVERCAQSYGARQASPRVAGDSDKEFSEKGGRGVDEIGRGRGPPATSASP